MPHVTYRPDIDALRAIAVLAVVAYHAAPAWLPGGFTGVDIFFVISGYLITGLLLRDAAHGAVSVGNFYARRVRRIFPALDAGGVPRYRDSHRLRASFVRDQVDYLDGAMLGTAGD